MEKTGKETLKINNGLFGTLWSLVGMGTFFAGVSLWSYIAASSLVTGDNALIIFAIIILSSAVGIGTAVGLCTKKALKNFTNI